MSTWVITPHDVTEILDRVGRDAVMDRVIDRLDEGMREVGMGRRALSPLRGGFVRDEPVIGVWEWMPHRDPGDGITLKTVGYSPANPTRFGLPTILGTLLRFDDHTGSLTALVDGGILTAVRTGAASAVAARLLADPAAETVGIIGAGAQSVTQLHALTRVRPIRTALVFDPDPARTASFADRVAFLPVEVRPTAPEAIAAAADILVTATSVAPGAGPVLPDVPVREHLHVNAVGADLVGKTELPPGLLRRSHVVADHPEQARREGESQQLPAGRLPAGIAELCARPELAHALRGRPTVYDSTGFALQDHLAMEVVLELAAEHDLGRRVQLEHHPVDAADPYSLPRGGAGRSRQEVDPHAKELG
jgi:ornithine cyclodeaminase/alanine dehydrogenase-like protein (mu-crystallin family)